MQWEYRSVIMGYGFGGQGCDDELNKLGCEGWELVNASAPTEDTFGVAFFKRPVQDTAHANR